MDIEKDTDEKMPPFEPETLPKTAEPESKPPLNEEKLAMVALIYTMAKAMAHTNSAIPRLIAEFEGQFEVELETLGFIKS